MQDVFPGVLSFKSKCESGFVSAEGAFESAEVVGLYFSGSWCAPCKHFTKTLIRLYHELKASGKRMEIVFVSEDEDEERMEMYYRDMPWLALRWSDVQRLKDGLQQDYRCESFPHLVLMNSRNPLPPITLRGCSAVACGPEAFPFTSSRIKAFRQSLYTSALRLLQQQPGRSTIDPLISRAAAKRFPLAANPVAVLRIITLNIWGGRQLDDLIQFFRAHGPHTDVFCLQEVLDTQTIFPMSGGERAKQGCVYSAIRNALPDFDSAFARHENYADRVALAMFVRRSLGAGAIHSQLVYDKPQAAAYHGMDISKYFRLNLQTVCVPALGVGDGVLVANFHGLWHPRGKTDIPERLEISHAVRCAVAHHTGPLVICGDFNLLPETKALAVLAQGLSNPLVECGITCTRTHLYRSFTDPSASLYADYILLSPELRVTMFEVLDDVVSDHAALKCELDFKKCC
jgi:endonuclease/exonuclease/phosphatase family metal-dependent hydrolase/thiol-disulfide isomerase/thioredoxin